MRDPVDEGDMAQEYQDRHNRDAVETVLAAARLQQSGPGSEICEDCGEEIPSKRREAQPGCVLCVECMRLHERIRSGM